MTAATVHQIGKVVIDTKHFDSLYICSLVCIHPMGVCLLGHAANIWSEKSSLKRSIRHSNFSQWTWQYRGVGHTSRTARYLVESTWCCHHPSHPFDATQEEKKLRSLPAATTRDLLVLFLHTNLYFMQEFVPLRRNWYEILPTRALRNQNFFGDTLLIRSCQVEMGARLLESWSYTRHISTIARRLHLFVVQRQRRDGQPTQKEKLGTRTLSPRG